ncbi:MAG TPA: o-succinylbenzoate synthase [Anaerolineae bacterium]|nr:o-succinylbenzoate synthase [Anaerolineae bacterium]
MIIDSIEIYRVNMPLIYPFRTAFGNDAEIESVLVKLTGGAQYGWGESSPWAAPAYSAEWAAGEFILLRDWFAPRMSGQDISSSEHLQDILSIFKGNPFAKAALDLAWWDLYAKQRGEPLWRVLGGKSDCVEVGADFGIMESIDLLLETIQGAQDAGFKRVKLKYRPGWELDMIAAVRRRFPDMVFHVDCNSAYRLENRAMLKALDEYNLAMIEQPLAHDDLLDHAKLQRELRTPICLDESIISLAKLEQAIELGACKWVNIKHGRVGGITNALAIHNRCQRAGIPVWIGGMLESAVGQAHSIALATLPNVKYPSDIFPTSRFYTQDLGQPEVVLSAPSEMRAVDAPGIGVEPNPEKLREMMVESVRVR